MQRIIILFSLLTVFAGNVFSASLSVEPTETTMYYHIPTKITINHTAIGTWQWSVKLSTDVILSGVGQVYNAQYSWTPNIVTDSGRFKIISTFGDSTESSTFKIKYGDVHLSTSTTYANWGDDLQVHWIGSNIPNNVLVRYRWNTTDYMSLGLYKSTDSLVFKLSDDKYIDSLQFVKFAICYEDGTIIKETDIIPLTIDYIALRNKIKFQATIIDSLKSVIVLKDAEILNLTNKLTACDSSKFTIDSLRNVVKSLQRKLEDSSKIQLLYKSGDIVSVENELPLYMIFPLSIVDGKWLRFGQPDDATYWLFTYDGKLIKSEFIPAFYKLDVSNLENGAYFVYIRYNNEYQCWKFIK